MSDPGGNQPLCGIRVLDIGTLLAGPFSATLLADFGAEVIKVEQPGRGDALRGSPRRTADGEQEAAKPLNWLVDARNKKSISLNLRIARGQALLRELVAQADVLVENFTPGTLEKWGLGWDELHALNPRLVMARVSGFGQTGPYSDRPGYDRIALGVSGYMYPTGFPDRYPVRPAFPTADYNTATFAAFAIMLALYHRDTAGGAGQMIDLALYEAPFRITSSLVASWMRDGVNRERIGNRNPGFTPAGTFETRDGRYVQIAAGGDNVWPRLAAAMGQPELADDPRFARSRERHTNADTLETLVAQWVAEHDFEVVEQRLVAAGVPVGGIYRAEDITRDPQFAARENIAFAEDADQGAIAMPGVVPRLSATPGAINWPGPALGEHNLEIYGQWLGLGATELDALAAEGVI